MLKTVENTVRQLLHPQDRLFGSVAVSCVKGFENTIKSLKSKLFDVAEEMLFDVPSPVGKMSESLSQLPQIQPTFQGAPVLNLKEDSSLLAKLYGGGNEKFQITLFRALDLLGYVTLIDRNLLVLRPQWLVRLFASVVTTNHGFVQRGVLRHWNLKNDIWRDEKLYPPQYHHLFYQFLEKTGILFPLSARSSGEEFGAGESLIPCLLPDVEPDPHFHWRSFSPPTFIWKRKYALQSSKEEGEEEGLSGRGSSMLPIGVIPRLLVHMHQLGVTIARWLSGCVLELESDFQLHAKLVGKSAEGVLEVEVRHWGGGGGGEERVLGDVAKFFRELTAAVTNLLMEFYHLTFLHLVQLTRGREEGRSWVSVLELQELIMRGEREVEGLRIDVLAPEVHFRDISR